MTEALTGGLFSDHIPALEDTIYTLTPLIVEYFRRTCLYSHGKDRRIDVYYLVRHVLGEFGKKGMLTWKGHTFADNLRKYPGNT